MGIAMMYAAIVMAFVAGLLIGAAIAYDKGFLAGKRWGLQLGAERHKAPTSSLASGA